MREIGAAINTFAEKAIEQSAGVKAKCKGEARRAEPTWHSLHGDARRAEKKFWGWSSRRRPKCEVQRRIAQK